MMKRNGLKSEETKTKHFLILIRFINYNMLLKESDFSRE
ncbi:Uncharacterised protein [[Ruminococcus] torques]|nr:Uncharacterised protein [[Ruminococcus] torques]